MKRLRKLEIGMITLLLAAPAAGEIVGWRMDGDGRYPDTTPPLSWSSQDNVRWKVAMESWSNASPILISKSSLVVVLSEPDEIVAIDSRKGEVAWRRSVGDLSDAQVITHEANGWTSATPVSDGAHIFSTFGSGVVAAYTLDGERTWARVVQEPDHRWGNSASPVLGGGRLIVSFVDLIGLDPKTGKEVWRAKSEGKWGSPIVTTIGGTDVVITPSGDVWRADNGERVASGIGSLEYATPILDDGILYFIEKRATAVRVPKTLEGEFTQIWESRLQGSRHYASALIHDGLIYAVSREQKFTILDAKTGELVHESTLDLDSKTGANSAYPSISLAGEKLFVSTENGTTAVLEPGRTYRELARNSTEGFRSSLVFDGDHIFLRAFDHLYCLASQTPKS